MRGSKSAKIIRIGSAAVIWLFFAVAVFIAQLVPGAGFHQVNVAVGFDRPRLDPNDANAIMQTSPAERLGEGHQGRVAGAAGNAVIVKTFTGRADDVDERRWGQQGGAL
jgi:hypothetical protein